MLSPRGAGRSVPARARTGRGPAEDLTGETFVRALRRIDSPGHQGRDVGAWLVTTAGDLLSLPGAPPPAAPPGPVVPVPPVVPGVSLCPPPLITVGC